MTASTTTGPQYDRFGSGFALALVLHALLAGVLIAAAFVAHSSDRWGENASSVGAIQASMVSAIPLPSKVPPVKDSVLAPDDASIAPTPPPKEAAAPPPRDTDILIKAKTPTTKVAPVPTPAPPKHPQPTPDTTRANSGEQATQLPQSISQVQNGTATVTVQDRAFGDRYGYYRDIVSRIVAQNWYTQEADPASSQGKSVTLIFDIERNGTPTHARIEKHSGSISLDNSALHALERVEGFGPLPAGDHVTVEYTFDYHRQ
jgi:protein TonB